MDPPVERVTHNFETLRSCVARGHGWGILVQHPALNASYEGLPLATVGIADPVDPAPVVAAFVAGARRSRPGRRLHRRPAQQSWNDGNGEAAT